ncbi:MAG: hypothetical protein M3407_11130 [Acidobacteriota bacterium]|nr:hypothetical protein [Acidobacteriota bacterium]
MNIAPDQDRTPGAGGRRAAMRTRTFMLYSCAAISFHISSWSDNEAAPPRDSSCLTT